MAFSSGSQSFSRNRDMMRERGTSFKNRKEKMRPYTAKQPITQDKDQYVHRFRAEKSWLKTIKAFVGLLLVAALVYALYFAYQRISTNVINYDQVHTSKVLEKETDLVRESYLELVKAADWALTEDRIADAQYFYVKALAYIPNGSNANYGLTKVLLLQCKTSQQYCTEATQYFNRIKSEKVYSKEEIAVLEKIKGSLELGNW
ncbi:MAG: hypothetical protein AAF847_00425 [Bacteroidota bacterium]